MRNYFKIGIISLIAIILFNPTAALSTQETPTVELQPLAQVLNIISVHHKINFLYEEAHVSRIKVEFDAAAYQGKSISQVLNSLLNPLNLSWHKVDEENYSIFPRPEPKPSDIQPTKTMDSAVPDSLARDQVGGRVLDEQLQPLTYATVMLLTASDSSLVRTILTDSEGSFLFTSVKEGNYKIRISAVGQDPYTTQPFTVGGSGGVAIETVAMRPSQHTLKEVTITSTRPLVERKSDMLVYNVENSAMATGNSLQLLRSAPFVRISADNSVSLQGKKTMILMDGKPVPDVSLEHMLQALPAGNIQKIELITNPSAKYDASYGAVINIITKKNQAQGLTGTFLLDGSIGKYVNGSTNISSTYKSNRLSIYANGGINKGDNFFGVASTRFQDPTDPLYFMTHDWKRVSEYNNYSFQGSVDYQLNNNQIIGLFIDVNSYQADGPWASQNNFGRQNATADSVLMTDADFDLDVSSSTYNFNYRLFSDSGRHDLTALGTFTSWQRDMLQKFPSALFDGSGTLLKTPPLYQNRNQGDINVYIAQADYMRQFDNSWKFETGIKFQTTNSRTSVYYEDDRSGQMQQVPEYSSQNTLQESIGGAYGILSWGWANVKLQAGVRLEDTRANFAGHFHQHYTNLFPTFLYQHKLNKDIDVSAAYKRTISRAPYNELVPYSVFINQYNIEQGNPALVPAFDNIYSLNANIHKLNLSLSYTKNTGLIGLFPMKQDIETKVTYYSRQNLKNASDISLYLFYPLRITDWWETINSGTPIGYNQTEGMVLGQHYKLSGLHSDFKTSHVFTLSGKLKLQVDAYYWTDYVQDLSHNSGNKNVNASILLNFWEGKGQFRLGGNELVFKRNDYLISRNYGSFRTRERVNTDSRRVYIGFTYKFGKSNVQKNDTKLGNEDALRRL